MSKFDEIKETVWRCNLDIAKYNLAIFTFGNVSAIDRKSEVIAIKPSGVPYNELNADDIVIVDFAGKIVEGKLQPSSDTKTHLVLYKYFPAIGGVAHTHSTYAVAWAQAIKPIPIYGTTHADHLLTDVPCTDLMTEEMIKGDYEEETGNQIIKTFEKLSSEEIEMVLVARHGPFTWGKSPGKAVYNSVVLEELARMALLTLQINPNITRLEESLIEKHYHRKHGSSAYYGQIDKSS